MGAAFFVSNDDEQLGTLHDDLASALADFTSRLVDGEDESLTLRFSS